MILKTRESVPTLVLHLSENMAKENRGSPCGRRKEFATFLMNQMLITLACSSQRGSVLRTICNNKSFSVFH